MFRLEEYVSRETIAQYYDLLIKWNKTINLVSKNTMSHFIDRHVLDSLQLFKYIESKDISLIDLGSGAGFPGMLLALGGVKDVTLIESDSRKAAFLLQISNLLSCKVKIINERIENIENLQCDIVTARAFANLGSIFTYCDKIHVKDKYLLHKGVSYEQEIISSQKDWLFNLSLHDSITSENGKILEIIDLMPIL